MRVLLIGIAAITLSGCSWLGLGGNGYSSQNSGTQYGQYSAPKPAGGCNSAGCLSRWNVEGAIGTAFLAGGSALSNSGLNADSTAVLNDISMNDAYETGFRGELGGSYALAPNRKITANGFYQEHDSEDRLDLGTIGGETLSGRFSDYRSYGGEVGLRQYFAPRFAPILKRYRPYVEGKVGAAYVEDISIEGARLGNANFLPGGADVALYDGGFVPTAAGLVGLETPLTRYSTLGIETGLRYTGRPDSDNSVLTAGSPLEGANNRGNNWTVPLMVRGRYRF